MHIPDGFLNNQLSLAAAVAAAPFVQKAFQETKKAFLSFQKTRVLKMGLAGNDTFAAGNWRLDYLANEFFLKFAAVTVFIFAAQMINLPVWPGVSAHLVGGLLAGIILGPWAGLMSITVVLVVQALAFNDGGVFALGANIFNMGIVGCLGGLFIYKFLNKIHSHIFLAVFSASFLSVILAAAFGSLEISLAKVISLSDILPAMLKIHFFAGMLEGLITILTIKFIFNEKIL